MARLDAIPLTEVVTLPRQLKHKRQEQMSNAISVLLPPW